MLRPAPVAGHARGVGDCGGRGRASDTDPVTGKTLRLNFMDRRWLKPVVEETWGVHVKFSPSLIL